MIVACENDADDAEAVAVRSSNAYMSAFCKMLRDPAQGFIEFTPQERQSWGS